MAKEVGPSRVGIVSPAGSADPKSLFKGDELDAFRSQRSLVKDLSGRSAELGIRACYMVLPDREEELQCKLLESGMVCLTPESELERRPDGGWS